MHLDTPRLRIDDLRETDAAALFACRADPAVARYQGWVPADTAEVLALIRTQQAMPETVPGAWRQSAIRLRADGRLIGDLAVRALAEATGTYEFGVTVALAWQRAGYAHEAGTALLHHLFAACGADRVQASIDPRNTASDALLRSLGMRREALVCASFQLRGEWVDDVSFALSAQAWAHGQLSGS